MFYTEQQIFSVCDKWPFCVPLDRQELAEDVAIFVACRSFQVALQWLKSQDETGMNCVTLPTLLTYIQNKNKKNKAKQTKGLFNLKYVTTIYCCILCWIDKSIYADFIDDKIK